MPVSLIPEALQTVGGIAQSFIGGSKERKAENAIENLQTPTYDGSKSILDYYNQALQRYNTNPYQSQQYQYGLQQGNRSTAAGINALQDRRSAIGGISRLAALQNNNALQSGVAAEGEQNQRFGQLGQAAQLKSADDQYGFQINKLMPYQKQLDLLTAKAKGGADMLNAGLSNIFGGTSGASSMMQTNKQYGSSQFSGYSPQQPSSSNIFDYSNTYGE